MHAIRALQVHNAGFPADALFPYDLALPFCAPFYLTWRGTPFLQPSPLGVPLPQGSLLREIPIVLSIVSGWRWRKRFAMMGARLRVNSWCLQPLWQSPATRNGLNKLLHGGLGLVIAPFPSEPQLLGGLAESLPHLAGLPDVMHPFIPEMLLLPTHLLGALCRIALRAHNPGHGELLCVHTHLRRHTLSRRHCCCAQALGNLRFPFCPRGCNLFTSTNDLGVRRALFGPRPFTRANPTGKRQRLHRAAEVPRASASPCEQAHSLGSCVLPIPDGFRQLRHLCTMRHMEFTNMHKLAAGSVGVRVLLGLPEFHAKQKL